MDRVMLIESNCANTKKTTQFRDGIANVLGLTYSISDM